MTEDADPAGQPGLMPETLDPFSFFRNAASKIQGLGGTEQRPELAYGFHTHYVRCVPGHCTFFVSFENLQATNGVIHLRVHMLSLRPGSHARVNTVERLYFADLAAAGGGASIRFESLPGMRYALFGQVLDTTDASASGLTVMLDRPGADHHDEEFLDFEPTSFGQEATRGAELLASAEQPDFGYPVSQVLTPQQLRHPAFQKWAGLLNRPGIDGDWLWQEAFVLQALERYELLDRNADGLGYGPIDSLIPATLAGRNCVLTMVAAPTEADDAVAAPEDRVRALPAGPIDPATMQSRVHILSWDEATQQRHLGPFDFMWSLDVLDHFSDLTSVMEYLSESMRWLRPGGIGIHATRVKLDAPDEAAPSAIPDALTRAQVERISLNLLSQGHTVAQLRFALGDKPRRDTMPGTVSTPFGLIVRRA